MSHLDDLTARRAPRPLRVIGGHLALDFANTVDDPGGDHEWDHLGDYDRLAAWTRDRDSLAPAVIEALPRPTSPEDVVQRSHTMRAAIQELFGPLADPTRQPLSPTAWATLKGFAADAVAASEPAYDGNAWTWRWTDIADPMLLLHPVAAAAHALVTDPRMLRLKQCANCPWLFLDLSRNHSRRWCDMDDCGRAVKMEKYVHRRRQRLLDDPH